jgi:hypothetical protein
MKKELKLKLIEGIFDQSDTNEIILSMIEKKIQFHELNSFRNFVKHNKKDTKLQKRIDALKKERKLFIAFIKSKKNQNYKVHSEISIQLI